MMTLEGALKVLDLPEDFTLESLTRAHAAFLEVWNPEKFESGSTLQRKAWRQKLDAEDAFELLRTELDVRIPPALPKAIQTATVQLESGEALMPADYFLLKNGGQSGPFSLEQLRSMWTSGLVDDSVLVWQEGLPDWISLRLILDVPVVPKKGPPTTKITPFAGLRTDSPADAPELMPQLKDRMSRSEYTQWFIAAYLGLNILMGLSAIGGQALIFYLISYPVAGLVLLRPNIRRLRDCGNSPAWAIAGFLPGQVLLCLHCLSQRSKEEIRDKKAYKKQEWILLAWFVGLLVLNITMQIMLGAFIEVSR